MGNSTPCKVVTPKNFNLKLCIHDYVGEATNHANFGSNRYWLQVHECTGHFRALLCYCYRKL